MARERRTTRLVFAKGDHALIDDNHLLFTIRAGQPWDGDDALVRRYPWAFAEEPLPEHIGNSQPGAPEALWDVPGDRVGPVDRRAAARVADGSSSMPGAETVRGDLRHRAADFLRARR